MDLRKAIARKTTLIIALIAVAAVALGLWRFFDRTGSEQKYRTAPAKTGDISQTVSANGTLNPVVLVSVGTQVSGTVKKLYVDFNDHVKSGQILLELDPALLQAQLRQDAANVRSAQAALELAIPNEQRNLSLWEQDSIARLTVDQAIEARKAAQAQLDQARAQLAKDRTNLEYSVIRSPVSGVVVNRTVDVGQTVAASFQTPTLFLIAQDLRKMQIDSSFAEADVGSIKVGQPVQFTVDAFPDRAFNAKVKQIRLNPTTQQNVVTYDVVVAVDNPEQILMPGMTAYVNVIVERHSNVVQIPNAALRFKPAEATANVAKGNPATDKGQGRAGTVYVLAKQVPIAVPLRIGISDGRFTEVLAGNVKDGDQLVIGTLEPAADQSPSTLRMRLF
jgi:HlyD family secretion protein